MKKLWHTFRKSIVTKTLYSVGIRIALIITLLTSVSYWHLFTTLEENKLAELQIYTKERGARESQIFQLAEDNHRLLKAELLQRYSNTDVATNVLAFDQMFVKQGDGAYRNNPDNFDASTRAGMWIGEGVDFTDDVKHRTVLFNNLVSDYGKSWQNRFINTYALGPENFATMFWPEIPDFAFRIAADFDIRTEEYFSISTLDNNPTKETVWTGLYRDQQADMWMVSVETPIYYADTHIATIGNDIALDELFARTLATDGEGYKLIFRSDGRLIADPHYIERLKETSGDFMISRDGDASIKAIYHAVMNRGDNRAIKLAEIDAYLFVTELSGPGWILVNVVPASVLTEVASSTAAIVFLFGLIALMVELLILCTIMKQKITWPLLQLTRATLAVARGHQAKELDAQRPDELGRLARSFNSMRLRLDRRDKEIFENQQRFKNAFDHSPIGMAIVGLNGEILEANENLSNMFGYSPTELREIEYRELLHPDEQQYSEQKLADIISGKVTTYEVERRLKKKDGSTFWCLINVSVQFNLQGQADYIFTQTLDIDERKRAEVELNRLAFHDPLTGLANRTLLTEFLEKSIRMYRRNPVHQFAVLFLDLDGFKLVNDSLGHLAGDQLLKSIAKRLKEHTRGSDTLSRFGGDEFCILVNEFEHEHEVVEFANRINQTLAEPFSIGRESINVSASVGIVLASAELTSAEDYLRDADSAMYHAKQQGSGNHAIFNAVMHKTAKQQLRMRNELTQAYENREFIVYYQPLVRVESGETCGFESLVRWQHNERGVISPDQFLPVAESMGLIADIDFMVLESAIAQLVTWRNTLHRDDLTINCNASSELISDVNTVRRVQAALEKYQLPADCLNLEITESVLINDTEETMAILSELKALGVNIHLDDFGTGFSSLSYLTRFPIDALKIDRSFISRINEGGKDKAIVESILLLAKRLGIKVIAEGVETAEQYSLLGAIGVDKTQGYYHGKPAPADSCTALLSAKRMDNHEGNQMLDYGLEARHAVS